MDHFRKIVLVGSAVAALALSACGDDEPTPSAATDTPADTSAAGPAADCDASPGTTVTVDIGDFVFDPTPVKVKACDSVVWKNVHDQAHTSSGDGGKSWNTGNLQPGASSEPVLFEEPGTLSYKCALHPFMKGVVEVS